MPGTPNEDFAIVQVNFSNGISYSQKDWLPNSARFTRNLSIFDDMNYVTLNPTPSKDSGSIVTDAVAWMEAGYPWDTNRYAYGDSGNLYKIATGSIWSVDHNFGASFAANGMCVLGPNVFLAGNTNIAAKLNLNIASPTFTSNLLGSGLANPVNIDITVNATGNTYAIPTTITEGATSQLLFGGTTTGYNLFAYDPIFSIALKVAAKGTGDWKITFHDQNNNVLGTSTVVNASLTNSAANEFVFSTPIRISLGATYHIHVTSTVNDGTLTSTTSNDLSTAWVQTFYGVLVSTQYHPMMQFTNGVTGIFVVGNESYLGTYDLVTYNPNKIRLEPGFSVRALATINNYIVAYATRGTDLTAYETGKAYVWDGIQPYYLAAIPLNMGMPNAAINFKQRLLGIFGLKGDFSIAPDETSFFRQIQQAPKMTKGYIQTTEPGAITVWQKRCLFSYAGTNDPNAGTYSDPSAGNHAAGDTYTPPTGLEPGVYEYGNQSDREITYTAVSTEVLNFAYQPSTPIVNPTNFAIGMIKAFGEDLYISYQDGATYYVDRVNFTSNPSSTGSWESLINDQAIDKYGQLKQLPQKKKLGVNVRVTFVALPVGCTVTAKYRLDRTAAWTFGKTNVAGDTLSVANIAGLKSGRYREIEYGYDVTASTNYPIITSVGVFFRPMPDETISGSVL